MFLKWFIENKLFDVKKREIYEICVEYCKYFITHVQKVNTKSASNNSNRRNYNHNHIHNSCDDNSTSDINVINYPKLSLDDDDVKSG